MNAQLLAALALSLSACGGVVATSSGPADDPDASPAAEAPRGGDAAAPTRDAAEADAAIFDVNQGPATEPACKDDTDCNEPGGGAFGRCWTSETGASSCLCKKGGYKQVSGRCGSTPPATTCPGQGGRCASWDACTEAKGHPASVRTPSACAGDAICCVAGCKGTAVKGCYVHGSDAAYVPVCVAGWVTCQSGDSPDLELP